MAEVIKRLGTTTATAATNVFDNGATASTYTVVSSIVICNTSSTAYTYNVSTSATTGTHGAYIASGATVAGNDTVALTQGWTLGATDVIRCYAGAATLTFVAFGVELT